MKKRINFLIADDHLLFAEGIASMFASHERIRLIRTVSNSTELMEQLQQHQPDLLLLDIKMPGLDGVQLLRDIRRMETSVKIIMLTTFSDYHTINTCKIVGADGYLLKNTTLEELESTIFRVMEGERLFPMLKESETTEISKYAYYATQFKLTRREWDLLQLVKEAKTNIQISEILKLSVYTVETHRRNIMQKLGLKSTGSLLRFIHENGI